MHRVQLALRGLWQSRNGCEGRRLIVTAATICLVALATTVARGEPAAPVLQGAVRQPLVLDDALLKSLPPVTVEMSFETGQGRKSGRYTGVLLWSLLEKAELVDEPGKNARLKHILMITGRDGYAIALALGEIDPRYAGKSVIIAYAGGEPPASSAELRLIVPGDAHGGRSVRDVATIDVR